MSKHLKQKKQLANNIRAIAVDYLVEMEQKEAYSTILFNQYVANYPLSAQDQALLTEIVYGTLQRKLTLDYYVQSFVKKPHKLQRWVYYLLMISFYQLLYLTRVPDYAVIFEAVEIAKKRGHRGVVTLVNGVLRTVQRQGVPTLDIVSDEYERFSIEYSMPLWLVKYLVRSFGWQEASALSASLLEAPALSVRTNVKHEAREQIVQQLRLEGIEAEPSQVAPNGLRILVGNIFKSTLFLNGQLTIQDESSMLVAPIGQLRASDRVLDSCSAPGGKTTHMAQFIDETKGGRVVALDLYAHKIELIEQNAKRLHVNRRIEAKQLDAREAQYHFEKQSFDVIYVDAPCSGLGLMRRKPDLKYTKTAADLMALHQLQCDILTSVAPLLKTGGTLVYSTCTFASEENEQTIAAFLRTHEQFQIDPIEQDTLAKSLLPDGTIQILPHHYGTDGFFICRLKKIR